MFNVKPRVVEQLEGSLLCRFIVLLLTVPGSPALLNMIMSKFAILAVVTVSSRSHELAGAFDVSEATVRLAARLILEKRLSALRESNSLAGI